MFIEKIEYQNAYRVSWIVNSYSDVKICLKITRGTGVENFAYVMITPKYALSIPSPLNLDTFIGEPVNFQFIPNNQITNTREIRGEDLNFQLVSASNCNDTTSSDCISINLSSIKYILNTQTLSFIFYPDRTLTFKNYCKYHLNLDIFNFTVTYNTVVYPLASYVKIKRRDPSTPSDYFTDCNNNYYNDPIIINGQTSNLNQSEQLTYTNIFTCK